MNHEKYGTLISKIKADSTSAAKSALVHTYGKKFSSRLSISSAPTIP